MPIKWRSGEVKKAFLKVALYGEQGTGKTCTASKWAAGLAARIGGTVYYVDSESGFAWAYREVFAPAGVKVESIGSDSFGDLAEIVRTTQGKGVVIVVDSLTTFWSDLVETARKNVGKRPLRIHEWGPIKEQWKEEWQKPFVYGRFHCFACGRMKNETDYFQDESGQWQYHTTGVRMDAEKKFEHEPDFLVHMVQAHQGQLGDRYAAERNPVKKAQLAEAMRRAQLEGEWVYEAHVEKGRGGILNGRVFANPTYDDLAPAVDVLDLGGEQPQLERQSEAQVVMPPDVTEYDTRKAEVIQMIELMDVLLSKYIPGQGKDEKSLKIAVKERAFGIATDSALERLPLERLERWLAADSGSGITEFEVLCAAAVSDTWEPGPNGPQIARCESLISEVGEEAYRKALEERGVWSAKMLTEFEAAQFIASFNESKGEEPAT